uniref:Uncharacterized protein n=1 Tax=Romanomermis culicivorax TaxID=13658 RepID=A0A915L2M6_ROMCU
MAKSLWRNTRTRSESMRPQRSPRGYKFDTRCSLHGIRSPPLSGMPKRKSAE